jgi:flavin reductase (DIM6/NTAB) family NADH-FMN oxidoreductase RutF
MLNCITGFKSAILIGTKSEQEAENLAVFNSVVHIGANPPLMGFILRPTTVRRDTYENIKATGIYTFNHINTAIVNQAHQTAASYEAEESEFDATGLITEYREGFDAPFVKKSAVKVGLEYVNEYPIEENGTILIIGKVVSLTFPDEVQETDGWLDLEKADTVAISGLDSYYKASRISRLSYAKVGEEVREI